jgi:hypothetical protein
MNGQRVIFARALEAWLREPSEEACRMLAQTFQQWRRASGPGIDVGDYAIVRACRQWALWGGDDEPLEAAAHSWLLDQDLV